MGSICLTVCTCAGGQLRDAGVPVQHQGVCGRAVQQHPVHVHRPQRDHERGLRRLRLARRVRRHLPPQAALPAGPAAQRAHHRYGTLPVCDTHLHPITSQSVECGKGLILDPSTFSLFLYKGTMLIEVDVAHMWEKYPFSNYLLFRRLKIDDASANLSVGSILTNSVSVWSYR